MVWVGAVGVKRVKVSVGGLRDIVMEVYLVYFGGSGGFGDGCSIGIAEFVIVCACS